MRHVLIEPLHAPSDFTVLHTLEGNRRRVTGSGARNLLSGAYLSRRNPNGGAGDMHRDRSTMR